MWYSRFNVMKFCRWIRDPVLFILIQFLWDVSTNPLRRKNTKFYLLFFRQPMSHTCYGLCPLLHCISSKSALTRILSISPWLITKKSVIIETTRTNRRTRTRVLENGLGMSPLSDLESPCSFSTCRMSYDINAYEIKLIGAICFIYVCKWAVFEPIVSPPWFIAADCDRKDDGLAERKWTAVDSSEGKTRGGGFIRRCSESRETDVWNQIGYWIL